MHLPDAAKRGIRVAIILLLATAGATAADSWLTPEEAGFFEAQGCDASINGKSFKTKGDLSRLARIAAKAEMPLRGSIEAYAAARARMLVSQDDLLGFYRLQQGAETQLRKRMGPAMVLMLLGEAPWDAATWGTGDLPIDGRVVSLWRLQAQWLDRAIQAQPEADEAMRAITERFGPRIGTRAPASELPLRVDFADRRFTITGRVGGLGLVLPLFQAVVRKVPVTGEWAYPSIVGATTLRAMGVEGMDCEAAFVGGHLAGVRERVAGRPILITQLLPTIAPGGTFLLQLNLPPGEVPAVDRIDLRMWSGEAWLEVEGLPGLEDAREQAILVARKDRQRRIEKARADLIAMTKRMKNNAAIEEIGAMQRQLSQEAMRQYSRQQKADSDAFFRRLRGANP